MNAHTFTVGQGVGSRRRVTVRRRNHAWPWVVTIERRDLPPMVLPYRTFAEACEDVRYLLDLRRRLSAVRS